MIACPRSCRRALALAPVFLAACTAGAPTPPAGDPLSGGERRSFQASEPWSPRVALNAEVAIVYGIDQTLPDRMKSWRDHGYVTQVMTGVSWGQYQDYLRGRWDGRNHEDEIQTDKSGRKVGHGGDVYYMSPGPSYGEYLAAGVLRALDAGAEAVYLEEPEFWARSGWSEGFKREWKEYYHEEWVSPDSSAEAQYRASQLKYTLYRRALGQVFSSVKRWSRDHGKSIPCYVPTHSLLNYAHWHIVSPESSLSQVGCDGYVAQVWTGTSRTPNVYRNVKKERTFETAFLEYGAMQNLVRDSGRRIWYLNDPIEDDPNHTWSDYRENWQSTLVASLLQPEVWRYEIMPWPHRIFTRKYPAAAPVTRGSARIPIPPEYETELQTVITALGEMNQPPETIRWEQGGTRGVGVLVSDTLMFQRSGPFASDEHLGSFYGLAMPLVKAGLPIEPVQIESSVQPGFLDRYRILLLTYEGQKPPSPDVHQALAAWVRAGGALIVVDDDQDPYNAVREWWNTGPLSYATPRRHLFSQLGLAGEERFPAQVGNGWIFHDPVSPASLTYRSEGGSRVTELVRSAADRIGLKWTQSSALILRRGPYIVAAGLDESVPDPRPITVHGRLVPLFDETLPVMTSYDIRAGTRQLLLDLSALPRDRIGVVAAACRVRGETVTRNSIDFLADGLEGSRAVVLVAMPLPPKSVMVGGLALSADATDYAEGALRIRFTNSAGGVAVRVLR